VCTPARFAAGSAEVDDIAATFAGLDVLFIQVSGQ
jgi:hypothetical protein